MAITSLLKTGGDKNTAVDVQLLANTDVDTDGSGDIDVTFPNLKEVYWASMEIATGYMAIYQSKSGNVVTFRVYATGHTVDAPFSAALSGSNLGAAVAVAIGRKA